MRCWATEKQFGCRRVAQLAVARGAVDRGAHEVDEVVAVEGLAHRVGRVAEAGLEALDRPAAALDVRVVGGEQRHLGAGLLDDPAHVLGGVRRGADLVAHELARAAASGPAGAARAARRRRRRDSIWRIQPGTQMAPCSITPIFSARVPLEHAVEDHRGERLRGRAGDGHVVDRPEVLVAAVEVGDVGAAVHEVLRVEQLPAAADVEHDRDAGLLRLRATRGRGRCGWGSARWGSRSGRAARRRPSRSPRRPSPPTRSKSASGT